MDESLPGPRSGAVDAALGARVRQLRLEQGLSQSALAKRLEISPQQVQKYESGSNRITAIRLVQMADALGVKISELLADLPGPPEPTPQSRALLDRLLVAFSQLGADETRLALVMIAENLSASRRTATNGGR